MTAYKTIYKKIRTEWPRMPKLITFALGCGMTGLITTGAYNFVENNSKEYFYVGALTSALFVATLFFGIISMVIFFVS